MTITRWNPWGEIFALNDTMDQLFQRTALPGRGDTHAFLPLDVRQTDEAFVIEASVPGFAPDEVEVTFDENVLTIRAQHAEDKGAEKGGYVRRERRQSAMFRQVGLPADIKPDDITAGFEHGVLTLTVPRAQKAQPRRITITRGASAPVVDGAATEAPSAG